MKLDKEQIFGIILMVAGTFIAADGITNDSFPFTGFGFLMCGFAVFLWTAKDNCECSEDVDEDESEPEKE